jgi:hypothetical protein
VREIYQFHAYVARWDAKHRPVAQLETDDVVRVRDWEALMEAGRRLLAVVPGEPLEPGSALEMIIDSSDEEEEGAEAVPEGA